MIGLMLRAKDMRHVAVYSVYEPPNPPADRVDRAENLVFLREGFSWGAAIFPPVWFAVNRAWLGVLLYFGAAFALLLVLLLCGVRGQGATLGLFALHAFFGFEAGMFQRWMLERAGWTETGIVSGRNLDACERRFFDAWLATEPAISEIGAGHAHVADALERLPQSRRRGFGAGLFARLRGHSA